MLGSSNILTIQYVSNEAENELTHHSLNRALIFKENIKVKRNQIVGTISQLIIVLVMEYHLPKVNEAVRQRNPGQNQGGPDKLSLRGLQIYVGFS